MILLAAREKHEQHTTILATSKTPRLAPATLLVEDDEGVTPLSLLAAPLQAMCCCGFLGIIGPKSRVIMYIHFDIPYKLYNYIKL